MPLSFHTLDVGSLAGLAPTVYAVPEYVLVSDRIGHDTKVIFQERQVLLELSVHPESLSALVPGAGSIASHYGFSTPSTYSAYKVKVMGRCRLM